MNLYGIDISTLEPHQIDALIEQSLENEAEIKHLEEILNGRKKELEHIFKEKKEKLDKENSVILDALVQFSRGQDDLHETPTMYKYKSLSGEVVINKPKVDAEKPKEDEIIKELSKKYPNFFKTEEVVKFDWAGFKKNIKAEGDKVYYEDGTDITDLIKTKKTDAKYSVKKG